MKFQYFLTKKCILLPSVIASIFLFSTTVFAGDVVSLKAYHDENTMYPMKLTDHPKAHLQSSGGEGEFPAVSGGNDGLSVKLSHLPSIAYVPYLVTGDYFYLEELQFWGNYGPIWRERGTRNYGDGLIYGTQVCGQARCDERLLREYAASSSGDRGCGFTRVCYRATAFF